MDKIFGETKHKIGDIVLVENTQFRYVGVVVDIMLSWDGYPMYSVYSIDSKDWCGVFTDAYVQPYTLPYESIGRYGKIGEELNHFDDVKVENRLKDHLSLLAHPLKVSPLFS